MRSVNASEAVSGYSPVDLATTTLFTDVPIVVGETQAKAVHLTELRTAVNAVRVLAGSTPTSWAESVAPGSVIKAAHVTELRNSLDPARAALGLAALSYTDPSLAVGYFIKALHFTDLRDGVK